MVFAFEDEWMGAASLWMVSTRTGELAARPAKRPKRDDLIVKMMLIFQLPD